jgi:hypothetical protein
LVGAPDGVPAPTYVAWRRNRASRMCGLRWHPTDCRLEPERHLSLEFSRLDSLQCEGCDTVTLVDVHGALRRTERTVVQECQGEDEVHRGLES